MGKWEANAAVEIAKSEGLADRLFDAIDDANPRSLRIALARADMAGEAGQLRKRKKPGGMPAAPDAPTNAKGWAELARMTPAMAKRFGLGNWDGGLFLFPGAWADSIPKATKVEAIDGEKTTWGKVKADRDTRFGFMAYGVRLGLFTDGAEK